MTSNRILPGDITEFSKLSYHHSVPDSATPENTRERFRKEFIKAKRKVNQRFSDDGNRNATRNTAGLSKNDAFGERLPRSSLSLNIIADDRVAQPSHYGTDNREQVINSALTDLDKGTHEMELASSQAEKIGTRKASINVLPGDERVARGNNDVSMQQSAACGGYDALSGNSNDYSAVEQQVANSGSDLYHLSNDDTCLRRQRSLVVPDDAVGTSYTYRIPSPDAESTGKYSSTTLLEISVSPPTGEDYNELTDARTCQQSDLQSSSSKEKLPSKNVARAIRRLSKLLASDLLELESEENSNTPASKANDTCHSISHKASQTDSQSYDSQSLEDSTNAATEIPIIDRPFSVSNAHLESHQSILSVASGQLNRGKNGLCFRPIQWIEERMHSRKWVLFSICFGVLSGTAALVLVGIFYECSRFGELCWGDAYHLRLVPFLDVFFSSLFDYKHFSNAPF